MSRTDLPARLAAHRDRQAALAVPGINHCARVEQRPAVAADAVTPELVLVAVQARDAAEVDHGATISDTRVHAVSLRLSL